MSVLLMVIKGQSCRGYRAGFTVPLLYRGCWWGGGAVRFGPSFGIYCRSVGPSQHGKVGVAGFMQTIIQGESEELRHGIMA